MTSAYNQADVYTYTQGDTDAEGNSKTSEHANPVFQKRFSLHLPSRYSFKMEKYLAAGQG